MAWVRFNRDFKWRVPGLHRAVIVEYRDGASLSVKADCARAAIADGAADKIPAPSRKEVGHGANPHAG